MQSPKERRLRAQLGAYSQWAKEPDRSARTAKARQAFRDRFEREVDPDGTLPTQVRELAGVAVRLTEVTQTPPRLASATTAPGERGRHWGQDLAARLARPKPATSTILVWSWPAAEGGKTWHLPTRRVRAGVELLAALPYDGAVLAIDGRHWRVSWGSGLARRQALPLWLAPAFGGKLPAA